MSYARWLGTLRTRCRLRSYLLRQCLAEFLGVFVLIVITLSASAQNVTSEGTKGNFLSSSLASGVAVMVAVHVSGGVSGGHLNPAFSLTVCLLAQFPWWKLPIYFFIQLLGAFVGAGTVYVLYYDAIHSYSNGTLRVTGPRETASIFATYPAPYLSIPNGFFDQVLGTGMLVLGVLAIIDARNKRIPPGLDPLAVGLLVFTLSIAMGANCSCAINPARDLGPRLFTYVAGWGPQVFRSSWIYDHKWSPRFLWLSETAANAGHCWWWVPVAAPMLGAVVGTAVYQFGVEFHHPADPKELENSNAEKLELGCEKEMELPVYVANAYAESWKAAGTESHSSSEPSKRGLRAGC